MNVIIVLTVLLSVLFGYFNGLMLDGYVVYLAIDAIFLAVFEYVLESNRLSGNIGNNTSTNYKGVSRCYAFSCLMVLIGYFSPAYTMSAIALVLFMSVIGNPEIAVSAGIFLSVLLCVATGGVFYELAAYCILVLVGAQLAKTMHDKKYRIWGCLILLSTALAVPMLFYYLANGTSSMDVLEWNLVINLLVIMVYMIMSSSMYDKADHAATDSIEAIIKEDYPLIQDVKNYSMAEYVHAMKVSTLARKCAKEINADKKIVAAAGFYYRLGVLEGEPFIENGVKLAQEKCFPEVIITILSEYNGEQKLPSSRESAIVHMVDACLKKIEMLNEHNLSTSWNQDMVIYQTLNEMSATGMYDESGLSMNQFLKVRELLVREGMSYDNKY
ncbi:MAG: hypothetical protein NC307_09630 [Roseburia sp.]|nr:hypothetical protein [Roseburia sp.]